MLRTLDRRALGLVRELELSLTLNRNTADIGEPRRTTRHLTTFKPHAV